MKGVGKFMSRTPHMVSSKVGMAKKSTDADFEEYGRKFEAMETAIEKLIKDSKKFNENVLALLVSGAKFGEHFGLIFHPVVGEYDLIGRHPNEEKTIRHVDQYTTCMQELKETLSPELELIETRVIAPAKELQTVMKAIRKTITKRDHKLVDYDRHNNGLTKLREKKEKSLSDEKNLFKLEQDFEIATQEYDHLNMSLKQELPQFMVMATQFIDPLFHSFYYMQLNIFYLMMEKLQGFVEENKFRPSASGAEIQADYQNERKEVSQQVEELHITKRIASTGKMMQVRRQESGLSPGGSLSRSTTSSTTSSFKKAPPPPPPGSASSSTFKKPPPPPPNGSSFSVSKKAPPPPPPSSAAAPPPPYTPGNGPAAALAAATKRAPPPPPATKPKPKPKPAPQPVYVVALYDFAAQADGDLDFKTGDKIEVVSRTDSQEDWWTGKLNGRQGVFPGNYVRDA